ncbi:unnamed protein product [Adineta ricciae]|uniref:Uncharacterized protein n=1 Tax=Adineta ricciae TaxID=249248 RepID=A0A815N4F8_ADIRI|nr:unnamed protein product [Adineta ricciae]CAF1431903.1 unnamed protein product [Adineta ricciae]
MIQGRFNYDEVGDLVCLFPESDILYVLLLYPTSDKEKIFTRTVCLTGSQPTLPAIINVNNDEVEDLAILHCNGLLAVFIETNAGVFDRHYLTFESDIVHTKANRTCYQLMNVADLNRNQKDDLIIIDNEKDSIRILLASPCDA